METPKYMKQITLSFIFIFCVAFSKAQTNSDATKVYKVAIFSPLYLDSVFDGNAYKFGKTSFPKYAQAGLDFVNGAKVALDSLPLDKGTVEAKIYDTKSASENVAWLINNHALDNVDLIVGSVKDADLTQLATFAKSKKIPFVSATSPNDGGILANPSLILINTTLRSHCEGIYSYLLQNHTTETIFLCRKKGAQEDKIADYFKNINEIDGKPLLDIQTINFDEDFTILKNRLDSNNKSVLIGASLGEAFATSLTTSAYELKNTYPIEVFGMPNWDVFAAFKKNTFVDFPVTITTSNNPNRTDIMSSLLHDTYKKYFKVKPSENAYKGFESVFYFTMLINSYQKDFAAHVNDGEFKTVGQYKFMPAYVNKKADTPDYYENKHVFFLKIINGKVVKP
jgi:Periplasmic binding protein